MEVKFNNTIYKRNGRNGKSLKNLCFDIFKYYISIHKNLNYEQLQDIFNDMHCNNNFVVLNKSDWEQKTENLRGRYFDPINYNNNDLYFTTQWGNNGGNCDNINKIIKFAEEQNYSIEILQQDYEKVNISFNSKSLKTKNIILYGAPGVGKTHNYQNLITMIENGYSEKEIFDTITTNENIDLNNEEFQNIKDDKRVEFVTFHQSYSYEDFIEGFRPNENSNIELEDGIFKKLSNDAINQSKQVINNTITFDDAFSILRTQYIENELDSLQTVRGNNIIINDFQDKFLVVKSQDAKNWQYVKKTDLETVVSGVISDKVKKPADIKTLNVKKDTISLAGYYFPIANKVIEIINANEIETKEQKNFYIVIDEINRGNISKIFGELITLIEESKRDNYEVTLPYSKEKFKVPSNLYIIATMNSTDKSIATIDIALRRRFTFLKMKPNPNLVKNEEAKVFMMKLNSYIKKELGEDFMLGHSYFMCEDLDLEFVIEYKIKPLLEEYFYSYDATPDQIIAEAINEAIEENE